MRRLAPAGAVLVSLLAFGAAASAAETVDLGYKQDTGPNPSAFFAPETVERPISFQANYTADPAQPLEIESYIDCTRGSESVSDKTQVTVTPPYSVTIIPTLSNADSCWIILSAEPPCCDGEAGTIRIEATASREPPPPPPTPPPVLTPTPPATEAPSPYWQQCSRPRWLARGALHAHGDHLSCRRASRIATKAWRRPKWAGHVLRMGRWRCVRAGHRRHAVVHCLAGLERLKLVGTLRQR